jgi:prepilin peptidase CpaA
MVSAFFPNLDFAWGFIGVLFALLVLASGTDLRRYVIPKWITLTALGLGLVANIVRGTWLGIDEHPVWLLGNQGPVIGGVDGLLFALSGLVTGFTLFFLMWIFGVCGGGDVKLFAALGAWLGPFLALCVLLATIPVVLCFTMAQIVVTLAQGNLRRVAQGAATVGAGLDNKPRRRVLGFALPVTIATAAVVLWIFRFDLQLVPPVP